ncbi:MAG: hypothetical protein R3288_12340 [Woeseiaceae bacterium]|nr:hypothetical protein [Woeseiaceae bacterium]
MNETIRTSESIDHDRCFMSTTTYLALSKRSRTASKKKPAMFAGFQYFAGGPQQGFPARSCVRSAAVIASAIRATVNGTVCPRATTVVACIGAVAALVEATVDGIAAAVITPVYAITLLVEATVGAIASAIESVCKAVVSRCVGSVRPPVQAIIDAVATIIETIVDTVTAVVKTVVDAIAAFVETLLDTVAALVKTILDPVTRIRHCDALERQQPEGRHHCKLAVHVLSPCEPPCRRGDF